MKTYAEVIAKSEELKTFPENSVEAETRWILLDLAGTDSTDMCSEAGVNATLFTLEKSEDEVVQLAARTVYNFMFSN